MSWTAFATAVGQAAVSPDPAQSAPDVFSPRTPISVAPIGVNLGEIIQNLNEGSPVNGGHPASIPLDLGWSSRPKATKVAAAVPFDPDNGGMDISNMVLLGVAGLVGIVVIWRMT